MTGARGRAEFKVVVCTCSDRRVRRARLEDRVRGILGWTSAGAGRMWNAVSRGSRHGPPRC
jgi:hypothetical protein